MAVHPLFFIILLTLVTTLPSLHPYLPLSHLLAPSIAPDSLPLARGSFTPIESAGAHRVAQVYPSVLGAEEVLRVVEVEVAVTVLGAGREAGGGDTGPEGAGVLAQVVRFPRGERV